MIRSASVLLVLLSTFGSARADPETDADAAFRIAGNLAAKSDPAAIAAFEQLGATRPITRWTDDAWAEAGRLAENARDYPRARRAYVQAVALGTDDRLVLRARGALARIEEMGGEAWDAVRATHERLASEVNGDGDPRPGLRALAALVHANPGYPRANLARLTIAMGWETEGDRESALAWFREAADAARTERGQHVRLEYVRALIRAGELATADTELDALDPALTDRGGAMQAGEQLGVAHHRRKIRIGLAIGLGLLVAGALAIARRDTGSVRALLRRLSRPPTEAWFLAPLALLLAIVAWSGNPLVARAVRWIGLAGVALAWLSGCVLEVARTRGPLGARRIVIHTLLVLVAAVAAAYLVVDGLGLLNLLGETWRGGPAMQ